MTREAGIGWLVTVLVHGVVLFGFHPQPSARSVRNDDGEAPMEVALYAPPAPAASIAGPADEASTEPDSGAISEASEVPEVSERVSEPPVVAPEPPPSSPPSIKPPEAAPKPPSDPSPRRVRAEAPPRQETRSRSVSRQNPSRQGAGSGGGGGGEAKPSSRGGGTARAPASGGYQDVGSVSYVRRGRAVYPADALRRKQTGTVQLMLYIDESGKVDRVEVVGSSGFPALDAAAASAEKKSRFRPVVRDGVPVKSRARVPYTFRLE